MKTDREVVVTGMGVVSSIGIGTGAFWDALLAGKSGVGLRPEFVDTDLPIKLAAPIKDFEAKQFIKPRKAIKIMCPPIQFACAAAAMASEQANLADGNTEPDRLGTLFGTEMFFAHPSDVADVFHHCTVEKGYQHERWGEFAMRKIQPLWMLKHLPNMAASHISIANDARGHSNSICQGDASGLLALIEAAGVIQRGSCDVVVTGGTGSSMELNALLYRGTDELSQHIDAPEKACRPFDKSRDGLVPGEGAGAIIIESAEHAAKRGARPLARIGGWSQMYTDYDAPEFQQGIESCFQSAVHNAGLEAKDIGWVNADACGSVTRDPMEAKAIHNVFGDVPVVAHKSNFGSLGPAVSTLELIGAILGLQHNLIPPTLNFETPDPDCPVSVSNTACKLDANSGAMLKSSISTTGQLASIVLKPA